MNVYDGSSIGAVWMRWVSLLVWFPKHKCPFEEKLLIG